jgi:tetratricopeptide (TPR) repeat protein
MHLGSIYVDAGEYDKAIECYRNAEPPRIKNLRTDSLPLGVESIEQVYLPFAWERLDQEDPFNPKVHLGFGDMFQKCGAIQQSEMEYKQALSLSPGNDEARRKLADTHLTSLRCSDQASRSSRSDSPFWSFEQQLAIHWQPPEHENCLVTRCRVTTAGGHIDNVELIGQSGSSNHDRSAINLLKSATCWGLGPFQYSDIYDVGCMSDGNKKTVAIVSEMGQWDEVGMLPAEQLSCCVQAMLK